MAAGVVRYSRSMSVDDLTRLLMLLGDEIRDIPKGPNHDALVERFFALVRHLQDQGAIKKGNWDLSSHK